MKKMKWLGMLSIGMLNLGFAQTQDSTKVEKLEEVVVTDTRFAIKRENSGKTVIKISRKEIENNQGRTLAQLINSKSGFEINGTRSVAGQNLGYFVRGGNNRQVLVLIDGIQVNDPSLVNNEFDLRLLDLNTIESVEIVKGASSTLYGNSAATAVINITTKKSSKKAISASFLSVVGTNQSQDENDYRAEQFTNNVTVNGTLNDFTYVASFGNQFAEGLSAAESDNPEADPFSRYNVNLKLGYEFSDSFSVTAHGSIDRFKTDIDGFPAPAFTFADTNDQFTSKQKRVGLAPKFTYKNGSVQVSAAYTDIERETISAFGSVNEAESFVLDAFNKYTFNENIYTIVGINYGDYKSLFAVEESFTNTDPYANVVYVTDLGLTVNIGGRLNNHSEYGSQFVYNINPSYKVTVNEGYAKVFGSYATSFIAPNLSQLFGFFGPNPNLEPEENLTIEGGFEFNTKKGFRISTVYFNRDEENTILFGSNGYENAITDATVQGVEIETEFNIIKDLSISANYTFTELKDGTRIRLPKHRANASLGYDFSPKTFASIDAQYVGKRQDTDFATFSNVDLEAYSLINLYFSHKLLENNKLKVFASVNNVFNEDYSEILGFTTLGRNASLGLNLKF
ncbi:TonB-dependent receptor [Winogradskyella sp. PC-19]|uniref:TonB-dependent receptor plug domain-containing protein n=1 Tax=unclassified Winogradskyella TaxID=2615021 RepID=UPI000B3BEF18|nr:MULTISPECIES: TonB-dependent receptor [unclassified Winogradskyella]ARV08864.1 TonB-dependent receptor [Winogradskyella sp. PC-19]